MNISEKSKTILYKLGYTDEVYTANLTEHQTQAILFSWWKKYNKTSGVMFAIPNGGKRHMSVAKELKAEGALKGVPDIMLALPVGIYHGLFLELKKKKGGKVSGEQKSLLNRLSLNGYKTCVAHGIGEAIEAIETYLSEV